MTDEAPNLQHLDRVMREGDEVTAFDINGEPLMSISAEKHNESGSKIQIVCKFFRGPFYQMFQTKKGPRHPLSPLVESVIDSDSPRD